MTELFTYKLVLLGLCIVYKFFDWYLRAVSQGHIQYWTNNTNYKSKNQNKNKNS